MHDALNLTNFIHLALLLGACVLCYMWGKISGAIDFALLLVDNKLITVEQIKKLEEDGKE